MPNSQQPNSVFSKILSVLKDIFTTHLSLVIVVLLLICLLYVDKCHTAKVEKEFVNSISHDTIYIRKDSTIYLKAILVKHDTLIGKPDVQYIADTNYLVLKQQYNALVRDYLAGNYYSDSIHLDTTGIVILNDTIRKNLLIGRSVQYHLKFPQITTTTTTVIHPYPVTGKNQVYLGAGVNTSILKPVPQIQGGVIFKTKNDQLYQGTVGYDFNGHLIYGFSRYWKLHF